MGQAVADVQIKIFLTSRFMIILGSCFVIIFGSFSHDCLIDVSIQPFCELLLHTLDNCLEISRLGENKINF